MTAKMCKMNCDMSFYSLPQKKVYTFVKLSTPGFWVLAFGASVYFLLVDTVFLCHLCWAVKQCWSNWYALYLLVLLGGIIDGLWDSFFFFLKVTNLANPLFIVRMTPLSCAWSDPEWSDCTLSLNSWNSASSTLLINRGFWIMKGLYAIT